ncbi:MAG TPA: ATPase, T2SS/T4P/T4SS family [Patescibacteria group bacterium]|nr:ATPase, T2SS/T4P/T4SS family [Patescibacteria group bacterium]
MSNIQKQILKVLNIHMLCKQIEKNFESFIIRQPENEQMKRVISILKRFKDSSTSGNAEDRNILKAHIKTDLLTSFDIYSALEDGSLADVPLYSGVKIEEDNGYLEQIMPFESPEKLTAEEKFNIILYLNRAEGSSRSQAFKRLIRKYDLYNKQRSDFKGNWKYTSKRYEYNKEDIDFIYCKELEGRFLNFADKVEIVVQIIYQSIFGLMCLDMLAYADVNEIGFSNDGQYIYCWCDIKIWLSFLELTKEEARVIQDRAIFFDKDAGQLDESSPEKLCYRADLARITVTQQPYSSARNLCTRIFNQRHLGIKELLPDEELLTAVTALARSGASICMQGSLGTGKTTTMSALYELLDDNLHIGIVEDFFEQHVMQKYPYKRIVELKSLYNKTLEDAVKTILRLSVDVADLGEVRSGEALYSVLQLIQSVSMSAWFTVHVANPETTVPRFKNLLLGTGRYHTEQSAVMDIVNYVNLIFQHSIVNEKRVITEIVEVVPMVSTAFEYGFDLNINTDAAKLQKLYYIQQIQNNPNNMYRLNKIMDARDGVPKFLNMPSEHILKKARLNKDSWSYMERMLKLIESHQKSSKVVFKNE